MSDVTIVHAVGDPYRRGRTIGKALADVMRARSTSYIGTPAATVSPMLTSHRCSS
jgi:hypothetical protein